MGMALLFQTTTTAENPTFTASDLSLIHTLSPLPPLPADTTNKYADSPAAAMLRQKLFFDPPVKLLSFV
jgi:hypothetical protein